MILDKVLLLKGLGGVAACTGLGCGAAYIANPDLFKTNDQILANLISKVGLKTCTVAAPDCSIEDSGLNVKQDNEKLEKKTKQASSGTEGKIKVYANNNDYNKGFKFVIEDGDITLTDNKKLEQFETYEIKEDGGKWYLTRKKDALSGKSKTLGLPTAGENACKLPSTGTVTCTLDEAKLKKINFDGKGDGEITIENNGSLSVTLTITKVDSSDSDFSTEGYKFAFESDKDITISSTPTNKIMKNTNTEFKIKKTENKLTLEKAWTVTSLAQKAGLTSCDTSAKTCDLPTSDALKLYNSSDDKITNGKVSDNTKKLTYEEDKEGYNQGFKFFSESEITLADSNSSKKIEASTVATYEIKEHTENNSKTLYLTKKANATG